MSKMMHMKAATTSLRIQISFSMTRYLINGGNYLDLFQFISVVFN